MVTGASYRNYETPFPMTNIKAYMARAVQPQWLPPPEVNRIRKAIWRNNNLFGVAFFGLMYAYCSLRWYIIPNIAWDPDKYYTWLIRYKGSDMAKPREIYWGGRCAAADIQCRRKEKAVMRAENKYYPAMSFTGAIRGLWWDEHSPHWL
eukprot:NODE_2526_length_550_cov_62.262411_g2476_i0.p1 GENE.NODE_2526_length_550_cov_62.262411_g2476_i0~~NODE_2526_length_550_cov_62.262411_g2476_i0.p1  ORF type:complete len:149 (+),score=9.10 NODE_2526_length_550_cov_62.262411_g2476_i0:88-534(+)